MKKKLLVSTLLACSLVTLGGISAARAEPLPAGTTILETVDSVQALSTSVALRVEGIVEGETQARTFDIFFSSSTSAQLVQDRCLKFLLLAQSHPGRYVIELAISSSSASCKMKSR